MIRIVLVAASLFLSSCNSQSSVPDDVLPPNQMKKIVFDLLRADEYVTSYVFKDTSFNRKQETIRMYEHVFLVHKISRDEFFKSYQYYQEHPDKHKVMFDSLANWAAQHRPSDSTRPAKTIQ
ncbi:DUF4296 domain-containing protein [Segetibacter sp. 3557_3]|uniref:DUF4296 domain-containing protein n=1 Tax=Segetibacter sp. 3557_3 TaxID=2547429 RepID=UPI001058DFAC|nr:DUF4296 domain-containing protein [Segetibacter sp. 3557_3]TDH18308.1 DUF4296 domain-containing protein [Segetibacter sp. 3557_3]